jgi:hypothetical protein
MSVNHTRLIPAIAQNQFANANFPAARTTAKPIGVLAIAAYTTQDSQKTEYLASQI